MAKSILNASSCSKHKKKDDYTLTDPIDVDLLRRTSEMESHHMKVFALTDPIDADLLKGASEMESHHMKIGKQLRIC